MGAALVQKKGGASGGAVASLAVTLDSAPTAGNLLVAVVNSDATIATPSGFTLAVSAVSGQGLYIFYRFPVVGGDSATVTFTPDHSTSVAAGVLEYSGILSSPLDKTASNTTGGGSSIATGTTATTSQGDELLIAVIGPHNPTSGSTFTLNSITAGYTTQLSQNGLGANPFNTAAVYVADRIVAATGTYTATGTISPNFSDAGAAIATFKASAAGQTVAVGLASETDTAFPIGRIKSRTIGLATETDVAFPVTPRLSSATSIDYVSGGPVRLEWSAGASLAGWQAGPIVVG